MLGLFALFLACGGEEPPPPPPTPEAPPVALSPAEMQAASPVALVPSPLELQSALARAGIAEGLAWKVKPVAVMPEGADPDRVAVRTGVVLADLLLTASTADASATSARVAQVRAGLAALGAKPGLLAELDELDNRIKNGALSGPELVKELDELAGSAIPRAEAELPGRAVPLIRAGSWVEGSNLVAGALLEAGRFEVATDLLRQPAVVAYFRGYVSAEGGAVAPSETLPKLKEALERLDGVCQNETFGEAEVKLIQDTTASVLALL